MTNSKAKGDRAELKAAKLCQAVTGEKWHRVPMSGAVATAQGVKSYVFKGDIFNEESYNDVCVEVKDNIEPFRIHHLFTLKKFRENLQQAKYQSNKKDYVLFQRVYASFMVLFPASQDGIQSGSLQRLWDAFLVYGLQEEEAELYQWSIPGYRALWVKW